MPTCRRSRLSSRLARLPLVSVASLLAAAPFFASNVVSCSFSGGDRVAVPIQDTSALPCL
jgi:hypothetical protein